MTLEMEQWKTNHYLQAQVWKEYLCTTTVCCVWCNHKTGMPPSLRNSHKEKEGESEFESTRNVIIMILAQ
jgi:hypothetical protein